MKYVSKGICIFIGAIMVLTLAPIKSAFAGTFNRQLMTNGGFESVPHGTGWMQWPNLSAPCSNDCLLVSTGGHSGHYMARMGGATDTIQALMNYPNPGPAGGILLPGNSSLITLSYYYWLSSNDLTENDFIPMYIFDVQAGPSPPIASKIYLSHTNNTNGWVKETIDLTAYRGHRIYFIFIVDNDAQDTTTFSVDDVSLTARLSDNGRPSGSIRINNNKKTTKYAKVTLSLRGIDNGSGVGYMRFSNNGKKWTRWIRYSRTFKGWDMSKRKYGGNSRRGTKKVYVQFKDRAGNISAKKTDTIRWKW